MNFFKICISTIILLMMLSAQTLVALSAQSIRVVKISPKDETAVIKIEKNPLKLIKVGDSINKNLKVVEISEGRIVLEEVRDMGRETIIIRVKDGNQKIEKIGPIKKENPILLVPQTVEKKD